MGSSNGGRTPSVRFRIGRVLRPMGGVALNVTAVWSDRRYLDLSLLEQPEPAQAAKRRFR